MEDEDLVRKFRDFLKQEKPSKGIQKKGTPTLRELWDLRPPPSLENKRAACNRRSRRRFLDLECSLPGGEKFKVGDLTADECTTTHFLAWFAAMAQVPLLGHPDRTMSPSYRQHVRMSLQGVLTYHRKHTHLIARNPLEGVPLEVLPGRAPRRQGYYTAEALEAITSHLPPVLVAVMLVARRCAMRKMEVLSLRKDDIDHGQRQFRVRKHKTGIDKYVPAPNDAYETACRWAAVAPGDAIFPNPRSPTGEQYSADTLWKHMDRAVKKTGLKLFGDEKPNFHHLRHTGALEMLDAGMSVAEVADQLGTSIEIVATVYGKRRGEHKKRTREKLERAGQPRAREYPCETCGKVFSGLREAFACLTEHEAAEQAPRAPAKSIAPIASFTAIGKTTKSR